MVIPDNATAETDSGTVTARAQLIDERYEIRRSLGEGAMGIVYLAHDQRLGRDVAIKQLSPGLMGNTEFLSRFRQEARALGRLIQPNIVQVFDFIETDGNAWIIMEYVDGETLDQRIGSAQLPLAEVLDISLQIAKAMAYAHDQGVIHRDLKPANILVTTDGAIKIMDFGVAKISESSMMTQVGTIMGSPAFMSPEQASGKEIGNSTDIYALGIMMYAMLCGELPFTGDTQSVIAQHLTRTPDSIAHKRQDLPSALADLVTAMLMKEAGDRPKDMHEIVKVLESQPGPEPVFGK
jgi:serine/threonine-protein kinase